MRKAIYFSIIIIACCTPINRTFSQTLPVPDHILIVILENHGYTQIIGSSYAPNINALANDPNSALFTNSHAIEHPSQPNYLDLYSGCNQGVTNDNVPSGNPFTSANLGSQLIANGKTFITYSETLPSVGYNGATSGNYARKHNPATNWMGTGTNQIPTTTNQPFTAFPSADFSMLPTVCYVIPNQVNDMHNGSDPARITKADTWIHTNLDGYIQWAKAHNSLFILTFDEDDNGPNNQIATIFSGQMVKAGQYSQAIKHYSVLRMIEDMYGLPYACNASTVTPISDCWNLPSSVSPFISVDNAFNIYPNPSNGDIFIQIKNQLAVYVGSIEIYNMAGEKKLQDAFNSSVPKAFHLNNAPHGMYFVSLRIGDRTITKEIIIE